MESSKNAFQGVLDADTDAVDDLMKEGDTVLAHGLTVNNVVWSDEVTTIEIGQGLTINKLIWKRANYKKKCSLFVSYLANELWSRA